MEWTNYILQFCRAELHSCVYPADFRLFYCSEYRNAKELDYTYHRVDIADSRTLENWQNTQTPSPLRRGKPAIVARLERVEVSPCTIKDSLQGPPPGYKRTKDQVGLLPPFTEMSLLGGMPV